MNNHEREEYIESIIHKVRDLIPEGQNYNHIDTVKNKNYSWEGLSQDELKRTYHQMHTVEKFCNISEEFQKIVNQYGNDEKVKISSIDDNKYSKEVSLKEKVYQDFLKDNMWILGSKFRFYSDEQVQDRRTNRLDIVYEDYRGRNIIEMKTPGLKLFEYDKSRDMYYIHKDLAKVISQVSKYGRDQQRNYYANKNDEVNEETVAIAKPDIIIIGGRNDEEYDISKNVNKHREILKSGFRLMTYDDVINRSHQHILYTLNYILPDLGRWNL